MGSDSEISEKLIKWYEINKRDLPWRESVDPYIIWISEIILQQTRVVQGMDYFLRFTRRFPNVVSLAKAEEEEVLKYWQGLGYYSRARNLHAAAKDIMNRFQGEFPTRYEDVLSLKGIGEYTAAAIVSFAWNKPYAVVDGNVYRVLARLFALNAPVDTGAGKKLFSELATLLLNKKYPGIHNQAIMELGALQCVPQSPVCEECPLTSKCIAYATGTVQQYPSKKRKTSVRNRYFHYFHIQYGDQMFLSRRTGKDIWKGLYELPLIETDVRMSFMELKNTDAFESLFGGLEGATFTVVLDNQKHVLSHQILYATFYRVMIEMLSEALQSRYLLVKNNSIDAFAVPRLIHIYLEKLNRNVAE